MWYVHLFRQKLCEHMWASQLYYATDVDVGGGWGWPLPIQLWLCEHNNFHTLKNMANYISFEMVLQQIV